MQLPEHSCQFHVKEIGRILFLELGLAVTEIKNVQKQENKNIKNVKICGDGMPKSMQTR